MLDGNAIHYDGDDKDIAAWSTMESGLLQEPFAMP